MTSPHARHSIDTRRVVAWMQASVAVLLLVLSTALAPAPPAGAAEPTVDGVVTVDTSNVLATDIVGSGVQWDPRDGGLPEHTAADRQLIHDRVAALAPNILRVMVGIDAFVRMRPVPPGQADPQNPETDSAGNYRYDWCTSNMTDLYEVLDWAEEHGTTVMLGVWDKPKGAGSFDEPGFVRAIADLVQRMKAPLPGSDRCGGTPPHVYDRVTMLNVVNEPNGDWTQPGFPAEDVKWSRWKAGFAAVHAELENRGLLRLVRLAGPDATDAHWVERSARQLPGSTGAYEFHQYPTTLGEISRGSVETTVRQQRLNINAFDPAGAAKPLFLGEIGDKERGWDDPTDSQSRVRLFEYGVTMADFQIQIMRGGGSGGIAWMLDDAMHRNGQGSLKTWGFWNTYGGRTIGNVAYPAQDREVRPWFYPMAMINRFFPAGANTVYASTPGIPGTNGAESVRTAAAVIAGNELSFAMVNTGTTARTVMLRVPGAAEPVDLTRYVYAEGVRRTDANGFPLDNGVAAGADLRLGVPVTLPAGSATFLSTLPNTSSTTLMPDGGFAQTDSLADWSKVAEHTAGWRFDATDPVHFQDDTSRITRTTGTAQSVTYRLDDLGGFRVKASTAEADNLTTQLTAERYDKQSSRWVDVPLAFDAPALSPDGWSSRYAHPRADLRLGTDSLRLTVRGPRPWSPQLTEVKLMPAATAARAGNLALDRPVQASSAQNSSLGAGYAVDGHPGTRWSSAYADPQWWYVDLGAPKWISEAQIRWESATARKFQLQLSCDEQNWTTVPPDRTSTGGLQTITFATPHLARYVKFYGWERNTPHGYSFYEFGVYPPAADPVRPGADCSL